MSEINDLISERNKLRLELHTLRFKESQEQRFIWWIYNVYSRNVNDLIYAIMGATTFDTEGEAKEGKWALPKHCFDLMKRIDEYTEHIYDGTYLDVEMSAVVKDTNPDYYNHAKTSPDNNKRSKWKAYVPKWGAPAVNKRYLVKLINDWITIATYYLRVGGGYWKDDRGQELADGVVSLWKGLEE